MSAAVEGAVPGAIPGAGAVPGAGVIGVLLAAGRGRRMGTTKQLLPWPGQDGTDDGTVVASAFDGVARVCAQMIVVLGHDGAKITDALGKRVFEAVPSDPDAEMFDSIRIGLRAARSVGGIGGAGGVQWVVLQPADHPHVDVNTLRALFDARESRPGKAIMPEYEGKGGHPALIPIKLVDDILAYGGQGGLRAYWQAHPEQTARVKIDDQTCVLDVDTPEAYERLLSATRASNEA